MKPTRNSNAESIRSGSRTFFATSSVHQRRALFQTQRLADLLIETILHYRRERKYQLHEFVVMPDHFHLLITLDSHISIEKAVQFVKGGFSFKAKRDMGYHVKFGRGGSLKTVFLIANNT